MIYVGNVYVYIFLPVASQIESPAMLYGPKHIHLHNF